MRVAISYTAKRYAFCETKTKYLISLIPILDEVMEVNVLLKVKQTHITALTDYV